MTLLDYQLVRDNHPELNFPDYWELSAHHKELLNILNEERLIARRVAAILSREDVLDPQTAGPMPNEI